MNSLAAGSWNRTVLKSALFACLPTRMLLRRGEGVRNEFALTFDDGPDLDFTPATLEILRRYEIQATFFLLGERAQRHPDLVKRIAADGHEISSHSQSHPYFHRLSWREAAQEIKESKDVLEQITGQTCRLFRPPYGKLAVQSLVPTWCNGQLVVLWSIDLKDYEARSVDEIQRRLSTTPICRGDIVLYHACNEVALQALPSVIEAAKASGLNGVTVSEIGNLHA